MSSQVYAYAYLRAAVGNGAASPLSVLKPLCQRAIESPEDKKMGAVSRESVLKTIKSKFGLSIPVSVVDFILRELVRDGLASYDKTKDGYFSINLAPIDYRSIELTARIKIDNVLREINRVLIDQQESLEAEQVLEEWLDGSALAFLGEETRAYNAQEKDYRYNRIIVNAIKGGGDNFLDSLADIAIGDAIFRAIVELTRFDFDQARLATRSISTVAVLDTPLVMASLGMSTSFKNEAAREVLEMCATLGMKTCVLSGTIAEIHRILTGAAHNMANDHQVTGEIREYILLNGLTSLHLFDLARKLDEFLRGKFEVIVPPSVTPELSISESELAEKIKERVRQRYPEAKQHDVDALAAIYRLREGRPKKYFDDAGYIFVTSNKNLADSATVFFQGLFRDEGVVNAVQLCMHTPVFASRLWTKLPTVATKMVRTQIVAQAMSLLRPNLKLKESFLVELRALFSRGLIDGDTKTLVEFTHFTDEVLSERYAFNVISISEERTKSVIDQVMVRLRKTISEKIGEGLASSSVSYSQLLSEIQEMSEARSHAEYDAQEIARKAKDLEADLDQRVLRLEIAFGRAERAADLVYWVALWLIGIFGAVFFLFAYTDEYGQFGFKQFSAAVLALASLYLAGAGERLHGLRTKLRRFFIRYLNG